MIFELQDCFEKTNWDIFEQQDLEDYISILSYIKFCMDTVTIDKRI